jgi:hypothetical protein
MLTYYKKNQLNRLNCIKDIDVNFPKGLLGHPVYKIQGFVEQLLLYQLV